MEDAIAIPDLPLPRPEAEAVRVEPSRCGPGTANYREAMAQLTSGRNGDRAECRYVVWFPI